MKFLLMYFSQIVFYLAPPILEILSINSSVKVRDPVLHRRETRGRIAVLCILLSTFLDRIPEDKRWYQAFPEFSYM